MIIYLEGVFGHSHNPFVRNLLKRYLYTGRDNLRTESTLLGEGEHKMKQINTTGHHKQASEILPITPAAINSLAM